MTTIDWPVLLKPFLAPTVIVALIATFTATGKGIIGEIEEKAELKAEIKYQKKYEPVLTENIIYRLTCCDTAASIR